MQTYNLYDALADYCERWLTDAEFHGEGPLIAEAFQRRLLPVIHLARATAMETRDGTDR